MNTVGADSSATTFNVIAIELDSGIAFLSDRALMLGSDPLNPCLLQQSAIADNQINLQIEKQALTDYQQVETWINREAAVLEVDIDSGSVYDGTIKLDGVIKDEPTEQDGILSLTIHLPAKKIATLPNDGEITATEYPNAPDNSQGEIKPLIFGTVEEAELIPVEQYPSTTLKNDITETDLSIEVADATQLANSGSVSIDGIDYSYSSKTDNKLLGMVISQLHRSGTLVVQSGAVKYLAAGHAITSLNTVKADGEINNTGTADIAIATLTFAHPPTVLEIKGQENVIAEFDQVDVSDTASLSINAIRAVTATDSNISATGLPFLINTGAVELTRNDVVDFPPPTQDRIIKGTYSVSFSVNHNGNTGNAEVQIGGQVVWVLNSGTVVFNNTPAVFFYHDMTNQLPVSIERESTSGSIDVTVTAALRTISLGNLDSALYGQIANGQQFVINQTTSMPNRGKIKKTQLAIEWFGTDEVTGNADVYFDDVLLGSLNAQSEIGQTVSENVKVDIVSQGAASLLSGDINKSFSGGTASLSNTTSTFNESFQLNYRENGNVGGLWRFSLDFFVDAPVNVTNFGSIVQATWISGNADSFSQYANMSINGSSILASNSSSGSWAIAVNGISPGQSIPITGQALIASGSLAAARDVMAIVSRMIALRFSWSISPVSQNNQATFQNVAQSNRNLTNSGITTSHSGAGQDIDITIPAPPRTVVNTFTLPIAALEQWAYFTNKQAKITYTSAGAEKIALVRAVLLIDYDVIVNKEVDKITATVTGKSGNPADVMQFLADVNNQPLNPAAINRIRTWADAAGIVFSRRLNSKTDALTLLSRAAMQINAHLYSTETLNIIRWFDRSTLITTIDPDDLLSPAALSWKQPIHNAIAIKYKDNGERYTRIKTADSSNNNACKLSQSTIKDSRSIEIQAGFISDDATADQFLTDYAKRNAPLHPLINLELPFIYQLAEGDLIDYMDSDYRIISVSNDSGWLSLSAEMII